MFSTAIVTDVSFNSAKDAFKEHFSYYCEKGSIIEEAMWFLEQGADGLSFWDVFESAENPRRWSVISRFGHLDELESLKGKKLPDRVFAPAIHRLGDQIVDGRFPPYWGG